tara:strand:- start:84 stop:668 length:585 start_codon:yes stop_codon:yes gene_type:complete
MKKILILIFLIFPLMLSSQEKDLPFFEISDYPDEYSSTNIVARMIEGLGYRYYWATHSLKEKDLSYKPSDDSRTTYDIIEHIHSLSLMIVSSFKNEEFNFESEKYTYELLREKTLNNLKFIHLSLQENPDLSQLDIRFNRGGNDLSFPFWNQINGPISDAIWHCGQVVMNRRSSGNPLQSGVNVFTGKTNFQKN